jgi:tetrapyrrole methylase family protein/MazG family protein
MDQFDPSPRLTLLGLGPGSPELLTRQALAWLERAGEVYVRSPNHPALAALPREIKVFSLRELGVSGVHLTPQDVEQIAIRLTELAERPQGVAYAAAGDPLTEDAVSRAAASLARQRGLDVRILPGVSLAQAVAARIGADPVPAWTVVDALELSALHVPPFAPSAPALVVQLETVKSFRRLAACLRAIYPDDHPLQVVRAAGLSELTLSKLESARVRDALALYLPPLGAEASFEGFHQVVARLRAPDGCPWDREQTHLTLRRHLLEETYEALEAIDAGDPAALREELGDLLLQVVLHAQIAAESGEFNMTDVLRGIHTKIVRRHPHVFGAAQVDGVQGVLRNWEKLKEAERRANGEKEKSLLDGVPPVFPSLAQAQELQDRAARVGFDWPSVEGVEAKVDEELAELRAAKDAAAREAELGDLLFAVVNLARWHKIDAESALRKTNARFRQRFAYIEDDARRRGVATSTLSPDEMNALWEQAKHNETKSE